MVATETGVLSEKAAEISPQIEQAEQLVWM